MKNYTLHSFVDKLGEVVIVVQYTNATSCLLKYVCQELLMRQ